MPRLILRDKSAVHVVVFVLIPLISFVAIILPVQLWDAPVKSATVTQLQAVLLIILLAAAVARFRDGVVTPLNVMIVSFFMFFLVGAEYGLRYEDLGSNPFLIRCFLLVIIGFIAFCGGYSLPLFDRQVNRLPRFRSQMSDHRLGLAVTISIGFAAALFLYFFALVGGLAEYLKNMQALRTVAAQGRYYIVWGITLPLEGSILWYANSVQRSGVRPALFVPKMALLIIIVLALVIPLGNRIFFVHFVFSLLVCRLCLVPKFRTTICVAVLGIMMVGIVVYQLYRYSTANYIRAGDIPVIMADPESTFRYTAGEFAVLDDLAFALETWPSQGGFLMGSSYLYPLILPIPRAIWPAKPTPTVAFAVNVHQHGFEAATEMGGIGVTAIGEGYVNFAIPGVIANMLLLGLISRLMYRYARGNPGNPVVVSIYGAFLLCLFVALQGEVSIAIPFFLQYIIPVICFYKMTSRSSDAVTERSLQRRSTYLAGNSIALRARVR